LSASAAIRADDIHERQLDQQVQELRQRIDAQARRIDQLESLMRMSAPSAPSWTGKVSSPPEAAPWLTASNWDLIRPGMTEDQVTGILGEPNNQRAGEAGATTLLYALEVQEGVFLAGRVELRDGKVSTVQKPELR
jgi:hypothetical protein